MTQGELADQIGVAKSAISSYEIGRAQPSVEVLMKMKDIFEVSLDDLFFKDLSHPSVKQDIFEEPKQEYTDIKKLMANRIKELEREIREHAPDLAERLRLDED